MPRHNSSGVPSQRQLRVGEELRNALAMVFSLGETHNPLLDTASITVSEVRVSPDLKNATVYFMPLAGSHKEEVLEELKEHTGFIRSLMGKHIVLRHTPRLYFKIDHSYEEAGRINQLLNTERVRADITKPGDDSDA